MYNYKPSGNSAYICYDINGKRYYIKCLNKKVVKTTKNFYIKKFKNVDAKMISITEQFSDGSKRVLEYILDFESIKNKTSKKRGQRYLYTMSPNGTAEEDWWINSDGLVINICITGNSSCSFDSSIVNVEQHTGISGDCSESDCEDYCQIITEEAVEQQTVEPTVTSGSVKEGTASYDGTTYKSYDSNKDIVYFTSYTKDGSGNKVEMAVTAVSGSLLGDGSRTNLQCTTNPDGTITITNPESGITISVEAGGSYSSSGSSSDSGSGSGSGDCNCNCNCDCDCYCYCEYNDDDVYTGDGGDEIT